MKNKIKEIIIKQKKSLNVNLFKNPSSWCQILTLSTKITLKMCFREIKTRPTLFKHVKSNIWQNNKLQEIKQSKCKQV